MGWDLLHSIAVSLVGTIGWAAVVVAVGALAEGWRPSLATVFTPVLRRLLPLFALFVLYSIILLVAGLPLCVAGVIAAAADADPWLIIVLALVIGLPFVLYVMTRLAVAFQAFLLDEAGPVEAISDSWHMTSDNMLRLLGVLLLAVVAVAAIQAGLGYALRPTSGALQIILMGLIGIPTAVFGAAAVTLYYLRIRGTTPYRESIPHPQASHRSV